MVLSRLTLTLLPHCRSCWAPAGVSSHVLPLSLGTLTRSQTNSITYHLLGANTAVLAHRRIHRNACHPCSVCHAAWLGRGTSRGHPACVGKRWAPNRREGRLNFTRSDACLSESMRVERDQACAQVEGSVQSAWFRREWPSSVCCSVFSVCESVLLLSICCFFFRSSLFLVHSSSLGNQTALLRGGSPVATASPAGRPLRSFIQPTCLGAASDAAQYSCASVL